MATMSSNPAGEDDPADVVACPQPHEGVQGVERTDDLLALDDKALARRDIILKIIDNLWAATLVGGRAPRGERMHDRMNNPQPGDLAFVVDGLYSRDDDKRSKSLGIFLLDREEWWTTDEEWDRHVAEEKAAGGDEPERLTDHA